MFLSGHLWHHCLSFGVDLDHSSKFFVSCLSNLVFQMLWLIRERGTFERISASMTMRNHDWVRFREYFHLLIISKQFQA